MALSIPNTIQDGQDAIASPVQQNFDAIESWANSEVIPRDGSVAMTGALQLVDGNPAASTQFVEDAVADGAPVGAVYMWLTNIAPEKHLILQGQNVSRSTYAELFAKWGTTFGTGNGTTTFGLPDYRARFPVGRHSGEAKFDINGETGGSRDAIVVEHDHTVDINHDHPEFTAVSEPHSHKASNDNTQNFIDNGHSGGAPTGGGTNLWQPATNVNTSSDTVTTKINVPPLGATSKTTAKKGSSGTDANLPPYIVCNFIVRALP